MDGSYRIRPATVADVSAVAAIERACFSDPWSPAGLAETMQNGTARAFIAEVGYDPVFGARPLKRALQRLVENPLSKKILKGELLPGSTVTVAKEGDALRFAAAPGEAQ